MSAMSADTKERKKEMPQSKIVRVERKSGKCLKCENEGMFIQLWLDCENIKGYITMEFCWGCMQKLIKANYKV